MFAVGVGSSLTHKHNLLNAVPDDQEDIQGWWCEGDIEERLLLFFVGGVTGTVA